MILWKYLSSMKTNYPQPPNKRRRSGRRAVFLLVLIVTGTLAAGYLILPAPTTDLFHRLGLPVWRGEETTESFLDDLRGYLASKSRLQEEIREWERRHLANQVRLKQLEAIQSENQRLRELMNRTDDAPEATLAAVLTTPPQSPYDMTILDIGLEHGVEIGDRVVTAGAAIGEVRSVYSRTAIARLYSTPGVTTEGEVEALNLTVRLVGDGSGSFTATVPRDLAVERGMSIFLPGLDNYLLAEVVEIESESSDPFQRIRARSPVNVTQLRRVLVGGSDNHQVDL